MKLDVQKIAKIAADLAGLYVNAISNPDHLALFPRLQAIINDLKAVEADFADEMVTKNV